MELLQKVAETIGKIKGQKPLVHHITNYVTANDCANITLAAGASPVMAGDPAEAEDMVQLAASLVLNIGTLNASSVAAMLAAGKRAISRGIPVVFDPVGAGATPYRTATARQIISEVRPTVVRGNMSEIKTLLGLAVQTKGVDSTADEADGAAVAEALAARLGCIVAVTGKTDVIAGQNRSCRIDNGHPLLADVTGTGCMATSLVGACCAAADDPFVGTVAGIALMGIAGELAQKTLQPGEGIGTFRIRLFDAVSRMTPEDILREGKIS
ncbi:MAG TPA: hydroxyethylthiazole kinase [Selenomonadales bacterium]|nr:hydroxyethylthiazole kinase [Selenomonadales bacterium]